MQPETIPQSFSLESYDEAAAVIRELIRVQPRVGLVLGSGLGPLAEEIRDPVRIPYQAIPHFPVSTVEGHAGQLVVGSLAGTPVCAMQGRFHFYEGYTTQQITFPVRVMRRLGVEILVLTNAAGGLNPSFQAGDLMLVQDHIGLVSMAGFSPLRGPNLDEFGLRFPSMNDAYSPRLRRLTRQAAEELGLGLQEGVYVWVAGPNFETPAEVRFLRGIGADAVGMSTVPEAIVAVHAGMEVLCISSITNVAIDQVDVEAKTSHEEVLEMGETIVPRLKRLLLEVLPRL